VARCRLRASNKVFHQPQSKLRSAQETVFRKLPIKLERSRINTKREPLMPTKTSSPQEVEAFLAELNHPRKPVVLALRNILLEADPSISEGIKWNVPSFRTSEFFATMHLRAQDRVGIILHFGAKKRDTTGIVIDDPEALLEWLAHDRAQLTFRDLGDVTGKRSAVTKIVQEWIRHVE
jgi:Domain of unknown function (DU1801)